MTTYGTQLALGLVAAAAWAAVAVLWLSGHQGHGLTIVAAIVAFAAMLVTLVFGSLYLLALASLDSWIVTGTGLRAVVAVAGVVALLDTRDPRSR